MPLLHRKPFIRQKPPADLQPDEEVFLCKITHEVFRTYDEFFERTILCNSLVWSCALTGRAGLTYLEALESERRAKQSLQNFPQCLVVPLLHLASVSRRCRLTELCEDIYTFVKDRFFPGETVDVTGRNGATYQNREFVAAEGSGGEAEAASAEGGDCCYSSGQSSSKEGEGGGPGGKRREKEDREKLKEEHRRRFEEQKQRRRGEKERKKLEKERELPSPGDGQTGVALGIGNRKLRGAVFGQQRERRDERTSGGHGG